ncbi:MAG: GAF domain-containing protein, partial [Chloroflexota bacterium]
MTTTTNVTTKQNTNLDRLNSLYELIGRMHSVYELTDLLEFVADRALNLTGGRRGLLLLDDDREHTLQHIAVVRGADINDKAIERALEFVSTTVIRDVLEQGEPRLVFDFPADTRYGSLNVNQTGIRKAIRSVLAVPLKVETQLVGLIYIDHPKQHVFGQEDLDFLSAFASQAALAINRAREHQRQVDELTRLNELSRSVVQVLDLDKVLTRIVYEAIRMLNVETGSVLLLDQQTKRLSFNVSVSNGERVDIQASLALGQGLAGWVADQAETVCVNDVSLDERWYGEVEDEFDTRSIICIALQTEDQVLGVLQVLNKKGEHGFTQQDVARLSAFAVSATIAIENARLFEEASEARRLRALNQSALKLSSSLDFDTILNDGLDEALELLKADAGTIGLIDNQTQTDKLLVKVNPIIGNEQDINTTFSSDQMEALSQLSSLVLSGEIETALLTLLIEDLEHCEYPEARVLYKAGVKSIALVPIKVGANVSGTLGLIYNQSHSFNEHETSLLSGLAQIISLAVQNASHYAQMSAKTMQLTYLNEIGASLTGSIEVVQVIRVFIDGVNALLQTERASVFLIDEQTNELVLRYSNPDDTHIRLREPWKGIAGWVAQNDEPALVNDVPNDPRFLHSVADETGFQVHSVVCVPLKIEERVIGVVEALNKMDGGQFTPEHQNLLVDLSHWAAIAIQTARLYESQIQEQKRRVEAEARTAMADLILNMAHTMNNIVGAIRAWTMNLDQAIQRAPDKPVNQISSKVHHIQENAEEAIALIGSIRNPLESLTTELGPTDVNACVSTAVENCWCPDNIILTQAFAPNLPLAWASTEGLEAVFHNLISNAIQALAAHPQGGEIQISTSYTQGERIEIVIADDGPGIPMTLQDRIF